MPVGADIATRKCCVVRNVGPCWQRRTRECQKLHAVGEAGWIGVDLETQASRQSECWGDFVGILNIETLVVDGNREGGTGWEALDVLEVNETRAKCFDGGFAD